MNDFKRGGRFGKGGFSRGGFGGRGGFRGGGRDFGRPSQMFQTTCANCGKTCEVPFRPTGERPVYCNDCFAKMKGGAPENARGNQGNKPFSQAPRTEDSRIGDMKRLLESMNEKLDILTKTLDASMRGKEIAQALSEVKDSVSPKSTKKARATKKKK